jgi:hypothetical protein
VGRNVIFDFARNNVGSVLKTVMNGTDLNLLSESVEKESFPWHELHFNSITSRGW